MLTNHFMEKYEEPYRYFVIIDSHFGRQKSIVKCVPCHGALQYPWCASIIKCYQENNAPIIPNLVRHFHYRAPLEMREELFDGSMAEAINRDYPELNFNQYINCLRRELEIV